MVTHQGCPQTPGGCIRALGFARMGARGRRRGPIPAMCQYQGSPVSYHRALMVTHQGCPQTPGGRIRALGFASTRTRGRRRGPIPAICQYQGSPVSIRWAEERAVEVGAKGEAASGGDHDVRVSSRSRAKGWSVSLGAVAGRGRGRRGGLGRRVRQ